MAGQLHHWGRPTEKQQHVVPWGRQVLLDHVRSHKALAVGPICSAEERRGENSHSRPMLARGVEPEVGRPRKALEKVSSETQPALGLP